MSPLTVVFINAILAAFVVAALAYVCRVPFRLDRVPQPRKLMGASEELDQTAYERAAA